MSNTLVGILGLLTIVAIVVTLFKSKTQPAIAFIVWPSILALILVLGGRHSFDDIAAMIKAGFNSTGPTAALFVFSVLYFGIMTDAGMFDVIIGKLMKLVGDNVMGVALVTCIIALVGHLDGGGASTFCIVVPAMLPVYKRMHMRPTTLLRIAVLSMGVLNLMPWAGPTMRAASVLGIEAGQLWKTILPIQIFGIVLALVHAAFAGWQEKRRGAGLHGKLAETEGTVELQETAEAAALENELARPKLFLFNVLLTVAIIAMLIWDVFPSYFPFMVGVAVALFVNYGFTAKMHKKIINLHAGPALKHRRRLPARGARQGSASGHRRSVRASGPRLRHRLLLLRHAARRHRHRPGLRRQRPAHRRRHGRLPQLRHLHQPHGPRDPARHRPCRYRHQGPHQGELYVRLGLLDPVHDVRHGGRHHVIPFA